MARGTQCGMAFAIIYLIEEASPEAAFAEATQKWVCRRHPPACRIELACAYSIRGTCPIHLRVSEV
jgi:hypothetical protein